jgi:hypothetical protein
VSDPAARLAHVGATPRGRPGDAPEWPGDGRPHKVAPTWQLALLAAFTLLLHFPFLGRPVQGDEVNYLDIARHVFQQPLTPLNFQYVFQGRLVDMAGHPHPPLNAYLLALLWRLHGQFSPTFVHAGYLLFALIISFAAYALASRFTARPLWTALLVASAPVVQVAANTMESDAPALAFLLAGAALFLGRRFIWAGVALSLAGLTALQTLAVVPILLLAIRNPKSATCPGARPGRAGLPAIRNSVALAAPFAVWAVWQALQLALTRRMPLAVMGSYMASSAYWGRLGMKAANVAALIGHLGILVVFLPLALLYTRGAPSRRGDGRSYIVVACLLPGILIAALISGYAWWERLLLAGCLWVGLQSLVWLWQRRTTERFLAGWCLLYFGFALLAFFSGSARYLLPLAAPLAILFVREFEARPRWLAAALAVNVALGLALAHADYDFARAYAGLPPPPGATFLVNGEWGFRYEMARAGGRMIRRDSVPAPGEWIVTSDLCLGANYDSFAENIAVPLQTRGISVRTPLRLVDRYAHSGYSSAAFGLLPFSFSRRPLDRITYSKTSPFIGLKAAWLPTQFSVSGASRLVYLPGHGAAIRLPLDPPWTRLRLALFARGSGPVTFTVTAPSGEALLKRTAQVSGELWKLEELPVDGRREVSLSIDAPAGMLAGWGELVAY